MKGKFQEKENDDQPNQTFLLQILAICRTAQILSRQSLQHHNRKILAFHSFSFCNCHANHVKNRHTNHNYGMSLLACLARWKQLLGRSLDCANE
uniref:Uncharacterized protein n=1 Tax=Rhizophora mucronata TaxID=61149 RepID=A0A2P2IQR0_RHIMU